MDVCFPLRVLNPKIGFQRPSINSCRLPTVLNNVNCCSLDSD